MYQDDHVMIMTRVCVCVRAYACVYKICEEIGDKHALRGVTAAPI